MAGSDSLGNGELRWGTGVWCLCCCWIIRLMGAAVGGLNFGVFVAGGTRPQVRLLLFSFCGQGHHRSREACVVWAASPEATGLLGAVGISATTEDLGLQAPPLLFPSSPSPVCLSPPTFKCADLWNSPVFWSVGQSHLCRVVDILLVADGRGEKKGATQAVIILTEVSSFQVCFHEVAGGNRV